MGVLVFIVMTLVGIGLVIYAVSDVISEKNPGRTTPSGYGGLPEEEIYKNTPKPTVIISVVPADGNEPPPLPPG